VPACALRGTGRGGRSAFGRIVKHSFACSYSKFLSDSGAVAEFPVSFGHVIKL